MKIVALKVIKYKKKNRIPGTDSAEFDCEKKIAEQLIADGDAELPRKAVEATASKSGADEITEAAKKEAEKLVATAKDVAAEIEKAGQEKADKILAAAKEEAAKIVEEAKKK